MSALKGDALLREKPSVKYEFTQEHCSQYRVDKMCKVLGVSESSFFKWLKRPKSERQKKHEKLSQEILQTHLEHKIRYGSRGGTSMKNKHRLVMNIIIVITYVIVSSFVLVLYARRDALSEVYMAFLPLAITAIVCIVLNTINKKEDTKEK